MQPTGCQHGGQIVGGKCRSAHGPALSALGHRCPRPRQRRLVLLHLLRNPLLPQRLQRSLCSLAQLASTCWGQDGGGPMVIAGRTPAMHPHKSLQGAHMPCSPTCLKPPCPPDHSPSPATSPLRGLVFSPAAAPTTEPLVEEERPRRTTPRDSLRITTFVLSPSSSPKMAAAVCAGREGGRGPALKERRGMIAPSAPEIMPFGQRGGEMPPSAV